MIPKRRSFLKNSSIIAGSILLGNPLETVAAFSKSYNYTSDNVFSILHTSGLSGHIAPTAGPFGGLKKVDQIFLRSNKKTLKIDSGNFLKAKSEEQDDHKIIKLMNKMGYMATTVGKNELSMGQERLASLLPVMDFELVNCNYSFSNTTLSERIKPYIILHFGKVKIGLTGVGCHKATSGVKINEPFKSVNATAQKLKNDLKCDLVVCLTEFSHNQRIYNNKKLAKVSRYVDLIIGGETGKVEKNAHSLKNAMNYDVMISQAGSEGTTVGELTYEVNQFNIITSIMHKYKISGMNEYASLKQQHEVFQILTSNT